MPLRGVSTAGVGAVPAVPALRGEGLGAKSLLALLAQGMHGAWGRYGDGLGSGGGRIGWLHDTVGSSAWWSQPWWSQNHGGPKTMVVLGHGEQGAPCRAVLSGVPTPVPFVPSRVGGTHKGSGTALLPPGAGGSGAGEPLSPCKAPGGLWLPAGAAAAPLPPQLGTGRDGAGGCGHGRERSRAPTVRGPQVAFSWPAASLCSMKPLGKS